MGSDTINSILTFGDGYANSCNCTSNSLAHSNSISTSNGLSWITTAQPSAYTTSDLVYRSRMEDYLSTVIKFLGEKEIDNLLEALLIRGVNELSDIKDVITYIIRHRHFSEDFLLKYFEHVTVEDIRVLHSADIASHDYAALALMIESKEC